MRLHTVKRPCAVCEWYAGVARKRYRTHDGTGRMRQKRFVFNRFFIVDHNWKLRFANKRIIENGTTKGSDEKQVNGFICWLFPTSLPTWDAQQFNKSGFRIKSFRHFVVENASFKSTPTARRNVCVPLPSHASFDWARANSHYGQMRVSVCVSVHKSTSKRKTHLRRCQARCMHVAVPVSFPFSTLFAGLSMLCAPTHIQNAQSLVRILTQTLLPGIIRH